MDLFLIIYLYIVRTYIRRHAWETRDECIHYITLKQPLLFLCFMQSGVLSLLITEEFNSTCNPHIAYAYIPDAINFALPHSLSYFFLFSTSMHIVHFAQTIFSSRSPLFYLKTFSLLRPMIYGRWLLTSEKLLWKETVVWYMHIHAPASTRNWESRPSQSMKKKKKKNTERNKMNGG